MIRIGSSWLCDIISAAAEARPFNSHLHGMAAQHRILFKSLPSVLAPVYRKHLDARPVPIQSRTYKDLRTIKGNSHAVTKPCLFAGIQQFALPWCLSFHGKEMAIDHLYCPQMVRLQNWWCPCSKMTIWELGGTIFDGPGQSIIHRYQPSATSLSHHYMIITDHHHITVSARQPTIKKT